MSSRKVCENCGTLFEQKSYWQKFCSPYCKKRKWDDDHPKAKKDRSASAFVPEKETILLGRNCEVCGIPLRGKKGDRRADKRLTCSGACKWHKYEAKKKGTWFVVTTEGDSLKMIDPPGATPKAAPPETNYDVVIEMPPPDPESILVSFNEGHLRDAPILFF